ncbi:MAG: hypothetical protein CSA62_12830 [Planctomycetota bacterium]|nr:MAG: hypothetical protein CSA62_12830 [Planctomycetota bacterium]
MHRSLILAFVCCLPCVLSGQRPAEIPKKKPAEKKEEAPARVTLQLPGKRKLEIGGGRYVLIVLEHPRLLLAEPQRKALARFAKSRGDRLEYLRATRADLLGDGVKLGNAVGIPMQELQKIGFGRAFPLVALFDAKGRRLFVTVGSGNRAFAQLEKLLQKELPGSSPKEQPPKPAPKPRRKKL